MPGCSDPWDPQALAEITMDEWLGLEGCPLLLPATHLCARRAQESLKSGAGGDLSTQWEKQSSKGDAFEDEKDVA